MLLSFPIAIIFSAVGVVAYVISYVITAVKFKEDQFFHRWMFAICFSFFVVISILTFVDIQ